jgi:hypothetical protein
MPLSAFLAFLVVALSGATNVNADSGALTSLSFVERNGATQE